jgi:hypothetical protein
MPQSSYNFCKLEPLYNHDTLNKQLKLLKNLANLNLTMKTLMGAYQSMKHINPIDYIYNSINCKLHHLKEPELESQFILKYIQSSLDLNLYKNEEKIKVERIFKMERCSAVAASANSKHNRNSYLLWYSCRIEDLLAILKNGIETVSGQTAIATTDSFVMSNSEMCGKLIDQNEAQRKYVFLCEIALGKCKEYSIFSNDNDFDLQLPGDCDSIKLCGKYEPLVKHTVTMANGCKVPLGRLETSNESSDIVFNRFVIHDPARVSLRYIVQYKQYN